MGSKRASTLLLSSRRILVGLLVMAIACEDDGADVCPQVASLVGGERTRAGSWQNVLWHDGGCSALLLSESVAVFAAHCGMPSRLVQGNALEVHINEDAGTLVTIDTAGARSLNVATCESQPEGEDLAFCILEDRIRDTPIVPAMLPCEREAVVPGQSATLVGFGFGDALDPDPGIRRAGQAEIKVAHNSLIIGDSAHGTCFGDSGGPAFVQLSSAATPETVWRALGILSSGRSDSCGGGTYVDLTRHLPWLEAASGHDLTPCGTPEGAWQPGPDCVAPPLDELGEALAVEPRRIRTCSAGAMPTSDCL